MYKHRLHSKQETDLPVGKVICVGRNYADHILELQNSTPSEPVLFMKPKEAICDMHSSFSIPEGECHNELEVALLIGESLTECNTEQGLGAVVGIGLGLDLTRRDVQKTLKQAGQPWERAKSFDNSCPLSVFLAPDVFPDLQNIEFSLTINGQLRQQGNTSNMLFPIATLLIEVSRYFTLSPGDVLLTGTPKGVGPLNNGDVVEANLADKLNVKTNIIS